MTESNSTTKVKVIAILEKTNDGYWASVDGLPGCFSFGKTAEEALKNVQDAISIHISDLSETGMEVPEIFLKDYEIKVKYDLRTLFDAFNFINKSAFAELAGINPSLMRQYSLGKAFASEKQKAKIRETLHSLGKKLEDAYL